MQATKLPEKKTAARGSLLGIEQLSAGDINGILALARKLDPRKLGLLADRVEREVRDAGGELSAARIGEICLDGLRKLDHGAYLQFAGTLPDGARSES